MARPQPDSRVEDQSPAQPQTCRMEVLRRDVWPSGGTQLVLLSRQRRRTVATQTSTVPTPVISTQDTASMAISAQQEGPLRDSSGIFTLYHVYFTCKWSVHVVMVCFIVSLTVFGKYYLNSEKTFQVLARKACFMVEFPRSAFCPSVTCCNLPWASSTQHTVSECPHGTEECPRSVLIQQWLFTIFPKFLNIIVDIVALVKLLWAALLAPPL